MDSGRKKTPPKAPELAIRRPFGAGDANMQHRDKNTGFVHLSTILKEVMENLGTEKDREMNRIFGLWRGAVGGKIADNAVPTAFKGHTLYVNVASSPWMQELRFLKDEIVEKINLSLGSPSVRQIKFRIGPV